MVKVTRCGWSRISLSMLIGLVATVAAASCSSPTPESGTNTNWVTCSRDTDCAKAGSAFVCVSGVCRSSSIADGSVGHDGAGKDVSAPPEAGTVSCHWPASADTSKSGPDGGLGCKPSLGCSGTACKGLCPSGDYVLTCHGGQSVAPEPSLRCSILPIPTPAGVVEYCCPCVETAPADAAAPGPCPASPPSGGDACSRDGQICSWGNHPDSLCRTSATCRASTADGGGSLSWAITPPAAWCNEPLLGASCPASPGTGPCGGDAASDTHCYYPDGTACVCAPPCCFPSGCVDGFHCMENPTGPSRWACEAPSTVPGCNPLPNAGMRCDLSDGTACLGRTGVFGLCGTRDAACNGGWWDWTTAECSVCASPDTAVATPSGDRAIASLRVGDPILSVDHGRVVAVPIAAVHRTRVESHRVVHVELANGSILEISALHPTADGRTFGELRNGDSLGGVRVESARTVAYAHPFTYDVLPASDSGTYFAGGVLIGSTLGGRALLFPGVDYAITALSPVP